MVIDLLKYMKLGGLGRFRRPESTRTINQSRRVPSLTRFAKVAWEYESTDDRNPEVFKQQHGLRKIRETTQLLSEAQSPGSFDFDPDHLSLASSLPVGHSKINHSAVRAKVLSGDLGMHYSWTFSSGASQGGLIVVGGRGAVM